MIADLIQLANIGHSMELLSGFQQVYLPQRNGSNNMNSSNNNNDTHHTSRQKQRQQHRCHKDAQVTQQQQQQQIYPKLERESYQSNNNFNSSCLQRQEGQCKPLDLSVKQVRSGGCAKQRTSSIRARNFQPVNCTAINTQDQQNIVLDLVKTTRDAIESSLELIAGAQSTTHNNTSPSNYYANHRLNPHTKNAQLFDDHRISPNNLTRTSESTSSSSSSSLATYSAPSSVSSVDTNYKLSSSTTCHQLDSNNNNSRRICETITSSSPSSLSHGRNRQKKQKGTKSHLCNQCGRSFSRSDMLTRHSRLHSGLKPYQCGKCFQVFSRSDHLSTHERTHTGEKPYQCEFCAYSACRRDMITRHMRTHTGLQQMRQQNSAITKSAKSPQQQQRVKRDTTTTAAAADDT